MFWWKLINTFSSPSVICSSIWCRIHCQRHKRPSHWAWDLTNSSSFSLITTQVVEETRQYRNVDGRARRQTFLVSNKFGRTLNTNIPKRRRKHTMTRQTQTKRTLLLYFYCTTFVYPFICCWLIIRMLAKILFCWIIFYPPLASGGRNQTTKNSHIGLLIFSLIDLWKLLNSLQDHGCWRGNLSQDFANVHHL